VDVGFEGVMEGLVSDVSVEWQKRICMVVRKCSEHVVLNEIARLYKEFPVENCCPALCSDGEGHFALHWAALRGSVVILCALLSTANDSQNVKTSMTDVQCGNCSCGHFQQTPLMWASSRASSESFLMIILKLLSSGANPYLTDSKGCSAFIHAAQNGNVLAMHALKVTVDGAQSFSSEIPLEHMTDHFNRSALHWSAFSGHLGAAIYCVRICKLSLSATDSKHYTPLYRAVQNDKPVLVHALAYLHVETHTPIDYSMLSNTNQIKNSRAKSALSLHHSASTSATTPTFNTFHSFRTLFCSIYSKPLRTAWMNTDIHWSSRIALSYVYVSMLIGSLTGYFLCCSTDETSTKYSSLVLVLAVLCSICFIESVRRNPGYLECGNVQDFRFELDARVEHAESKLKRLENGYSELGVLGVERRLEEMKESKYCYSCMTWKLGYSGVKHCAICDRCLIKFDHHCPWISNCVGIHNRNWLLAWIGTLLLLNTLLCVAFTRTLFFSHTIVEETLSKALAYKVIPSFLGLALIAFSVFASIVLFQQLRALYYNSTLSQYITAMKYGQIAVTAQDASDHKQDDLQEHIETRAEALLDSHSAINSRSSTPRPD